MTEILLTTIIVFDLLLAVAVLLLFKKQKRAVATLGDITAEREYLVATQAKMEESIRHTTSEQRGLMNKLTKIAAEIEKELADKRTSLHTDVELITNELASKFEAPLVELTQKQNSLNSLYRKIENERCDLEKTLKKASGILKFFNQKIPYEEIISEIEDKKYMDARRLLTSGKSVNEISERLGLPVVEVEMIRNLNSDC